MVELGVNVPVLTITLASRLDLTSNRPPISTPCEPAKPPRDTIASVKPTPSNWGELKPKARPTDGSRG